MNSGTQAPIASRSFLQQLWPWLIELWIAYVLLSFFIIRILGSGLIQRLLTVLRLRLAR
jgi:hypothetical protein